jgi:hypothetical protein
MRVSSSLLRPTAIAAAVLLAAASCKDDPTRPPVSAFAGSYALVSVSGRTLPAPYGQVMRLLSGTLVLRADGTAERRVFYEQPGETLPLLELEQGTFRVGDSGRLIFALSNPVSATQDTIRLVGQVVQEAGPAVRGVDIQWGNPMDGPAIVESYRTTVTR